MPEDRDAPMADPGVETEDPQADGDTVVLVIQFDVPWGKQGYDWDCMAGTVRRMAATLLRDASRPPRGASNRVTDCRVYRRELNPHSGMVRLTGRGTYDVRGGPARWNGMPIVNSRDVYPDYTDEDDEARIYRLKYVISISTPDYDDGLIWANLTMGAEDLVADNFAEVTNISATLMRVVDTEREWDLVGE